MNVFEAAVVVVAAVLAVRVLMRRPVRVEARAHPRLALLALIVALLLLALGTWVTLRIATVRHVVVGVLVMGIVIALWRAAPHYGRRRGLPPGSLGLGASLDAIGDPAFYRREVARWGAVFKMSQVHQPVVCIADLALAHEFFREHAPHLAQAEWSFNRLVPGGYLEYMRGDAHRHYRAALGAGLASADLSASRRVIAAVARTQLEALVRASQNGGVDPEPFLLPVAMPSLLRSVLGVDPGHTRYDALVTDFTDLIQPMELYLPVPQRARDTYGRLVRELRTLGEAALIAGDQAVPCALAAIVSHNPRALDDDTLVGNLVLMVKEGSIMVRGLLRWVLKMRCDHPEWAHRLREQWSDATPGGDLARRFVLETLRLHESRYVYRTATRDLPLGRFRVPRGWLVRLCLGEAHERDARFPDPQRFNPDRFQGDPLARADFSPFGHGEHACLGADLTLEVAQTFLVEATHHFDVRTVADGLPWRINRHWGLWRPSKAWRVVATSIGVRDPAAPGPPAIRVG